MPDNKQKIRLAIAGVGNSTSSLVQGLMLEQEHRSSVRPTDVPDGYAQGIQAVAAFDVDARKVGVDLSEAILAEPNCTSVYAPVPHLGVTVHPAPILDGLAEHVKAEIPLIDDISESEERISQRLLDSGAEILICQLPGGSRQATQMFARAALAAGVAFVNCNPEPVAHDPQLSQAFTAAGVPLLGDDIKSQLGTTVVHRTLLELFERRGVEVMHSHQLNFGGNNDFLNMRDRARFTTKQTSKHSAISAATHTDQDRIELVPPDHIRHLRDHKLAYVHIRGRAFLGMEVQIEVRLQVEDSPNSAGVAIEAVRVAAAQRAAKIGGSVAEACSPFFKRPPQQIPEPQALTRLSELLEQWAS